MCNPHQDAETSWTQPGNIVLFLGRQASVLALSWDFHKLKINRVRNTNNNTTTQQHIPKISPVVVVVVCPPGGLPTRREGGGDHGPFGALGGGRPPLAAR